MPRHRDVKQNDVGLVHARHPHRLLAATCFVFYRDVRFGVEKATQAGTDKRVVVNDQDADHNPNRLQAHNYQPVHSSPPTRHATPLVSIGPPGTIPKVRRPRIDGLIARRRSRHLAMAVGDNGD